MGGRNYSGSSRNGCMPRHASDIPLICGIFHTSRIHPKYIANRRNYAIGEAPAFIFPMLHVVRNRLGSLGGLNSHRQRVSPHCVHSRSYRTYQAFAHARQVTSYGVPEPGMLRFLVL
jgi:hypothetical protein